MTDWAYIVERWAVGEDGLILRYGNSVWRAVAAPTGDADLIAIARAGTAVYACTLNGTVYRYEP